MAIKHLTRQKVRRLSVAIHKRLEADFKAHGLVIDVTAKKFDSINGNATFSLVVSIADDSGRGRTPEATEFIAYANHFGLQPQCLNETFVTTSGTFTITGSKKRKRKYPIQIERGDKKVYANADAIRAAIARNPRYTDFVYRSKAFDGEGAAT